MTKYESEIRALLKGALDGTLITDELDRFMAKLEKDDDEKVCQAAHELTHFVNDLDIRSKDPEWDQIMRSKLQECLAHFESEE
jgi:hypothetical protein